MTGFPEWISNQTRDILIISKLNNVLNLNSFEDDMTYLRSCLEVKDKKTIQQWHGNPYLYPFKQQRMNASDKAITKIH
jgi:hypothetical protein